MSEISREISDKIETKKEERDIRLFGLNPELNDNEEYVYNTVTCYPYLINGASERLKNDRRFLIRVARKNAYVYKFLPNLECDSEFILEVVKENARIIALIPDESSMFNNRNFYLKAIKLNAQAFYNIRGGNHSIKNNPIFNFIADAAKANGWILKFVEKPRITRELVNTALIQILSSEDFIRSGKAFTKFKNENAKRQEVFTEKQWLNFVKDAEQIALLKKSIKSTTSNLIKEFKGKDADFSRYSHTLISQCEKMLLDVQDIHDKASVKKSKEIF